MIKMGNILPVLWHDTNMSTPWTPVNADIMDQNPEPWHAAATISNQLQSHQVMSKSLMLLMCPKRIHSLACWNPPNSGSKFMLGWVLTHCKGDHKSLSCCYKSKIKEEVAVFVLHCNSVIWNLVEQHILSNNNFHWTVGFCLCFPKIMQP